MIVAGVDEAGRGSILGPLVVAGVAVDESRLGELQEIGVKDSKKLSPQVRKRLYRKILGLVDDYYVYVATPAEIDRFVSVRRLNLLEADAMARIINQLRPDVAYVDSCGAPLKFGKSIRSMMKCEARLSASYHADAKNVAVSAASIVAKVNRDREISKIRTRYGNGVGSGYPSDGRTMRFVRRWVHAHRAAPRFARSSWRPLRELLGRYAGKKIHRRHRKTRIS